MYSMHNRMIAFIVALMIALMITLTISLSLAVALSCLDFFVVYHGFGLNLVSFT